MKIAVLMTCFNRKEVTMKALQSIKDSSLPEDVSIKVYLLDDNSKDCSGKVIKEMFPDTYVIYGTGKLYWNRGMFISWLYAVNDALYDYFIWFNDDTVIDNCAIRKMLAWSKQRNDNAMIGGFLCSSHSGDVSYGGVGSGGKSLKPNGLLQAAKELNGNFVLIPFKVYKKVGILELDYPHAIGDFDYSHRVSNAKFELLLSPEIVGVCEKNAQNPHWCNNKIKILKRLKALYTPKAYSHPYYQFRFEKKYKGFSLALFHFFTIHLRALFPSFWKGNGF